MGVNALALLFLVGSAAAGGSYRDADDISRGSKIHGLAELSLTFLLERCAASNALACQHITGASLTHVKSAQTQLVNGHNYKIDAAISNGGSLHLQIYETFSNDLTLVEALLTPPSVGMSFAIIQERLLEDEEEMVLDASRMISTSCTGGKQWKECGSHCEPTCDNPAPMCMTVCEAKCQCPADKPIFQDGECIKESQCAGTAAAAAAEPPCVPHEAPCPRIYMPVCAPDGSSYDNACLARAACVKEEDTVPGRCDTASAKTHPVVVPAEEPAPTTSAPATLMGGYRPAAEVHVGSKIHHLASFSLGQLQATCAASNSFACSRLVGASLQRVERAQTQVVSGVNYDIDAATSAGTLHLRIYEQSWTSTLIISEAQLTIPPVGASLAILTQKLVDDSLPLDAARFDAFVTAAGGIVAAPTTAPPVTTTVVAPDAAADGVTRALPPLLGGYKEVEETQFGSEMHNMAAFALQSLMPEAVVHRVIRAQRQTVAGTNFVLEVHTSIGCLRLKLFQQLWSQTLELAEAELITFEAGRAAREQPLLDEKLTLDAAGYAAYTAPPVVDPPALDALLLGGAPIGGSTHGGHFTGSDQELLAASPPPASKTTTTADVAFIMNGNRRDDSTQWFLICFFLTGVALAAVLAVHRKHASQGDEAPLTVQVVSGSSSAAVDIADLPKMAKSDTSIA